jgi:hypothetical protein
MIPVEALAELAALYDRFANHLDPLSDDWKHRKSEYFAALTDFHRRFASDVPFDNFRREAQRACFQWLRSNDRPSTPPASA